MSSPIDDYISSRLQEREQNGNYRRLTLSDVPVDFYSNDYLGFARSNDLKEATIQELQENPLLKTGSSGSRLLSGNSEYAEELENQIAGFHEAEAALLFNSGFMANYGLLSTLPYRADTIIYDELVHASIHDGIRNSKAESIPFKHNNLNDLKAKLITATGLKYVIVESLYSMDGDLAPLKEIATLCKKYEAGLIVDEAHATGLYGKKGEGIVSELEIDHLVLARVHTFGKALGAYGAVVLCNKKLKNFLINYCRPFIFATALPFPVLASVKCAYKQMANADTERNKLQKLSNLFDNLCSEDLSLRSKGSAIKALIVPGNLEAKQIAAEVQNEGYDVRAILHPTVAKGEERIRICLHSFNTEEEISGLIKSLNKVYAHTA